MGRRSPAGDLSRRQFLAGAAVTGFAFATGCSDTTSSSTPPTSPTTPPSTTATTSTSQPVAATVPTTVPPPPTAATDPEPTSPPVELPGDPFTLGVASGDPQGASVILWARLCPDPTSPERGGMPDTAVDVASEIARDEAFDDVADGSTFTTDATMAHSVHVDATGIEPGVPHLYRFRVGAYTSPVGQNAHLP